MTIQVQKMWKHIESTCVTFCPSHVDKLWNIEFCLNTLVR